MTERGAGFPVLGWDGVGDLVKLISLMAIGKESSLRHCLAESLSRVVVAKGASIPV